MNFFNTQSPLDQFEIRNYISLDMPILFHTGLSLNNISIYVILSGLLIVTFNLGAYFGPLCGGNIKDSDHVITNKWNLIHETIYATVHNITINQINNKKGQNFFPFIFSLFMFILVNNLISLVPYSFAATSHFILTFFLSFTLVIGATILGFYNHGLKFFSLFVPSGCPLGLLPLLVFIEFISYLSRNISLGLRLAANIKSEKRFFT